MLTRRIVALAFSVFALSVPPAVGADGPGVGVVVGANIASAGLIGLDATGISTTKEAGVYIGGFFRWPVGRMVDIEPEVAFSQKHFTVKDTLSGFTATEKWDWVEVPILVRVSVWHAGNHRVYAIGGPGFGFRARVKEEAAGQTSDIKDTVQTVDVSLIGGGGFQMGKGAVEVRYDGGVRNLNRDNRLGDLLTVKSRSITIDLKWSLK